MVFIKHKTLIIVSVLGLFFIGLCTTGYFLWQYQKEQQNKPGVLYREAIELAQKGELHRAVVFMKEALINEPNNSSMHWFLSLIYDKLEKDGKAQTHALLAWENNRKDKEVLFFIVKGCGLNTVEEKIKYGLSLIGEMPDENERLEMRADMHSAMEEIEKALIIYQQLFDKKATPQLVTKVAITLIGLKRSDEAMKLLRKSMTDNLLEEKGYVILSNILFLHQKKDELKALFENAKSTRSYHAELAYQHALLSTIAGRYAQANKILLDIIHSETYEKLKQQQSRLLLALNSLPLKDSDTLDKLTKLVQQDGAAYEGERLLYATLKNALRGTKPQILRQKFDTINKLLPRRFIILLLSARIDTSVGNPLKALKYYSTIKNPVYQVWPLLVIDHVVALRADGKVNEALSLIVHLHNKRKSYTLQSAILQRNLLLQIHDVDGARRIQDFLEQNYPDLVYLKLQGAPMALQNGAIEEADQILSELDTAEPYDLDIICMRAASFLSQKKYHKAINYLKEKPQSSDTLLITAKAYIALKNIDKAVETYEWAITNYPSERLHRIYSYFLIS
ncbi:MAG: CDC27 family protein, partial [Lentisphaeraceae bacterium]|nr:CDC27 family protein [Lentisphaeraceae bacterium]